MIRSLLVKGAFTESDLAELLTVFRAIEQRQTDATFTVAILEADLSMPEAEDLIRRTFPRVAGDEPTFKTFRKISTMTVICPDGQSRVMTPAVSDIMVDIERPTILMMQGTVEIDGCVVPGEAWRNDDGYHFKPC